MGKTLILKRKPSEKEEYIRNMTDKTLLLTKKPPYKKTRGSKYV